MYKAQGSVAPIDNYYDRFNPASCPVDLNTMVLFMVLLYMAIFFCFESLILLNTDELKPFRMLR